jgi:hypothetical protein
MSLVFMSLSSFQQFVSVSEKCMRDLCVNTAPEGFAYSSHSNETMLVRRDPGCLPPGCKILLQRPQALRYHSASKYYTNT